MTDLTEEASPSAIWHVPRRLVQRHHHSAAGGHSCRGSHQGPRRGDPGGVGVKPTLRLTVSADHRIATAQKPRRSSTIWPQLSKSQRNCLPEMNAPIPQTVVALVLRRRRGRAFLYDILVPGLCRHHGGRSAGPLCSRPRHCHEAIWRRIHTADWDGGYTHHFCTVVSGIAGMHDLRRVGRVGGKALLYFEVVSTLALLIGLVVGNVVRPVAAFT